uniref:Uncharacterized protein LOC8285537 isoform X1 n=1 Tax=Rhizophora mucronata TaxID=61149 RepID=A0A2P2LIW4_RHIMU
MRSIKYLSINEVQFILVLSLPGGIWLSILFPKISELATIWCTRERGKAKGMRVRRIGKGCRVGFHGSFETRGQKEVIGSSNDHIRVMGWGCLWIFL